MNRQILDNINQNKYLVYLSNIGVDINLIKDKIIKNVNEDELNVFVNRSHQRLSPNAYLESLVFKYMNEYLYNEHKSSFSLESEMRLDVKTIIATSISLIQRPSYVLKPSDIVAGFKEPDYENDFRIISRFERELSESEYDKERSCKGGVIFEGLLPFEIASNPLIEVDLSHHIWDNSYCIGVPCIQGFNSNFNSIETQYVLWMNSELLNTLELRLDSYQHGLRALNNNDEIVLIFRCWREQLIGNGASFVGADSNIAKLEGCDLILREDYFKKLKKIIPNLVYYAEIM